MIAEPSQITAPPPTPQCEGPPLAAAMYALGLAHSGAAPPDLLPESTLYLVRVTRNGVPVITVEGTAAELREFAVLFHTIRLEPAEPQAVSAPEPPTPTPPGPSQ